MNSHTIDRLDVDTYTVPTAGPEADGTLKWNATTAVVVHIRSGEAAGLGWTYSSPAAATVITSHLRDILVGRDPSDIAGAWAVMHTVCRNFGTRGLVAQALSAVDIALWDVKARLLDQPLAVLFGRSRDAVPIYGSGGFTNLDEQQLAAQVNEWRDAGCTAMKIKIGQDWGGEVGRDLERVRLLGDLAGDGASLMVDANGAYTAAQARRVGAVLDDLGVTWFEEPVSSDDAEGLDNLRQSMRCDIAAGEYIADLYDARRMAPVVDCLQLDVTRCGGYSGWLAAASVAAAHNLDVSAHCAPALHAPVAAAIPHLRHTEYFIDHARLEPRLFDGIPAVAGGHLHPDLSRPGHGMTVATSAERYRASR